MNDYKEHEWNREGDLLFTLKHAGWDKGEQQLTNRLMVRIDRTSDVPPEEHERLVAVTYDFLRTHHDQAKESDNA